MMGVATPRTTRGQPFTHAPSTNTTARFQLSISVLISFQLPTGAAFSRLVLVAGHAAARRRQREVEKPDATDARLIALLDRAADGQRRLLERLCSARRTSRSHILCVAAASGWHALPDRRQDHQAKEWQEATAGA